MSFEKTDYRCRSNATIALSKIKETNYNYTLTDDERDFLRQILMDSGCHGSQLRMAVCGADMYY